MAWFVPHNDLRTCFQKAVLLPAENRGNVPILTLPLKYSGCVIRHPSEDTEILGSVTGLMSGLVPRDNQVFIPSRAMKGGRGNGG